MPLAIPQALKLDHEEFHDEVMHASREEGALGATAKRLLRIMQPHMEKEESFAHPPLGLLEDVARGKRPDDTELAEVLAMTDRLRSEILDMLAEHRMIFGAIEEFVAAAKAADRVEYAELAIKLIHHAQLEERVLYPAVTILGNYLRLRFGVGGATDRLSSGRPSKAAAP